MGHLCLIGLSRNGPGTPFALIAPNLRDADLSARYPLDSANLTYAHLDRAHLDRANLTGATAGGGNLDGVKWPEDLTGVKWLYLPPPGGWTVDGNSGRLKRAGGLSEVMAHYL